MATLKCAQTGKEFNEEDDHLTYEEGGKVWYFVDVPAFHTWQEAQLKERSKKPKK